MSKYFTRGIPSPNQQIECVGYRDATNITPHLRTYIFTLNR